MKKVSIPVFISILISCSFNANSQWWKQYSDSAQSAANQKKIDKAIEYYIKAKEELQKDSASTGTHARICFSLALIYRNKSQYGKAEPLFIQAKEIWEKTVGKDHPDYALSCHGLASLYFYKGQYPVAEALWIEAREIRGRILGKDHPDYLASCNGLGALYGEMGKYDKAEEFYLEVKQAREKTPGKDHPDYALICNNLGLLYWYWAKFSKAEPLLIEAKKINEKVNGKLSSVYALNCSNLAGLYLNMADYRKAEPLLLEAKEIREEVLGKDHRDYASSCTMLAQLYYETGQYQKAEPISVEAKELREKIFGKDHPQYATSCNNLAILYVKMGEYGKAELLFLETKQIREKVLGREHPEYATSCTNLAAFYEGRMNLLEKAEPIYLEAKQITESTLGKEHPDYAISCENLANLYFKKGEYGKSESLHLEAKTLREKTPGKDHPLYASSCDNLAVLYENMGQNEKAESLYLEAVNVYEKSLGRLHPEYINGCNKLALFYRNTGQYKKSETLFLEAKQAIEKTLGKSHPEYIENYRGLAMLYVDMGLNEPAVNSYAEALKMENAQIRKVFQFTSEVEQQAYVKEMQQNKQMFYSFVYTGVLKNCIELAYETSLSARHIILSASHQLRSVLYTVTDTVIKSKYTQWINAKEQLSFWYTKPIADRPGYVKGMEEEANLMEKELTRLSSDLKKGHSDNEVSWKNIQQSLKPNEAAIEFVEFEYYNGKHWTDSIFYAALILRKDRPEPEWIPLFEKKQLDTVLKFKKTRPGHLRLADLYTGQSNITEASSLYNLIWSPLENKLSDIRTIYFAPAGILHKIAFSALPVSKTEVLSDKYRLIQLYTTSSVTDNGLTTLTTSDKILLYGGIQYDADSTSINQAIKSFDGSDVVSRSVPEELLREGPGDFIYLSGSEDEVNEIENLARQNKYSVTILKKLMATEESVKTLSGKNSPVVLHIATHGFFFPDPGNSKKDDKVSVATVFRQSDDPLIRSGLAMAGANNAWKGKPVPGVEDGILTSYEVSSMYLPNTKLAVLSACETGLGDIQGSEGVYGLQRAFKMAGVQNLLMSLWKVDDKAAGEFMQEFYKNIFAKQNISDAFYNAQRMMRTKYRNDPYKWAAWILVR